MTRLRLTLLDQIEDNPVRKYILDCDVDEKELEVIVSLLDSRRWGESTSLDDMKEKVYGLKKCNLIQSKYIIPGGYSGGPLGRRNYRFPSVYEDPVNIDVGEIEKEIKCSQEGSRMTCILDP